MRSGVKCCPTCAASQQELSCPAVLCGDHCSIPSLSPGYTQSTVQRILSLSVSAHRTAGVLWKQRCSLARAGRTSPWWARQRQDATPVLSRKMDVYSTHAHKRQYPRYHRAAAQRVPKDGHPHHHHHDHRGDSTQPGSAAHTCVCTGGATHWVEGGWGDAHGAFRAGASHREWTFPVYSQAAGAGFSPALHCHTGTTPPIPSRLARRAALGSDGHCSLDRWGLGYRCWEPCQLLLSELCLKGSWQLPLCPLLVCIIGSTVGVQKHLYFVTGSM